MTDFVTLWTHKGKSILVKKFPNYIILGSWLQIDRDQLEGCSVFIILSGWVAISLLKRCVLDDTDIDKSFISTFLIINAVENVTADYESLLFFQNLRDFTCAMSDDDFYSSFHELQFYFELSPHINPSSCGAILQGQPRATTRIRISIMCRFVCYCTVRVYNVIVECISRHRGWDSLESNKDYSGWRLWNSYRQHP